MLYVSIFFMMLVYCGNLYFFLKGRIPFRLYVTKHFIFYDGAAHTIYFCSHQSSVKLLHIVYTSIDSSSLKVFLEIVGILTDTSFSELISVHRIVVDTIFNFFLHNI